MKRFILKVILNCLSRKGRKNNNYLRFTTKNAMDINKNLLLSIINDNKDTVYGKKYNFSSIKSIEDYKKNVPVSTYEDYRPYIQRMIKNNENNLITSYPIVHYNLSSGTSSKRKFVPYSSKALDVYNKYGAFGNTLDKIGDKLNKNLFKNKMLILMTSKIYDFGNGITNGGLSERMLYEHKKFIEFCSALPKEAIFPTEDFDVIYIQARYALMAKDISYIMSGFCTQILQVIRYIEDNKDMLIKDIREGKISLEAKIPHSIRERLLKDLKPCEERALELSKIFDEGFENIFPKIWPNIRSISAISIGGLAIYKNKLDYYLGDDIEVNSYGYCASEGLFAMCLENDSSKAVAVAESCFFEFLPIGESDYSKTKTLDEVEEGKEYEIIITNLSGLYRYKMKDIIKVSGKMNDCPLIEFSRRASEWINTMGEKIEQRDLDIAIENLSKDIGEGIVDYIVHVNNDESLIHYDFYIEFEDRKEHDLSYIESMLQKELENQCTVLKVFVDRSIMGKCRVYKLKHDSFKEYCISKKMDKSNQYKQTHIIQDMNVLSFFSKKFAM